MKSRVFGELSKVTSMMGCDIYKNSGEVHVAFRPGDPNPIVITWAGYNGHGDVMGNLRNCIAKCR